MKKSLILFVLFILSLTATAQSYDGRGDQKFNIGYHFYGYENSGVKATYDIGLSEMFSVGAGATYFINSDENDYFIYARTNLHLASLLDLPQQLDIYPGLEIGYLSRNDIGITGYLGVKYFISKKIGLFAEFGTFGSAGLSFDF